MNTAAKKVTVALAGAAVIALTGCQYRSKDDTYYLVAPNQKLPYWKSVADGFKKAAEEYGVSARVDGPDGYDPAAEEKTFSDIAARHPAGILVSAADAGALSSDIASAIGAGVPVITVDSDAPLSARLYFIGTNNLEAGHLGGKRLVEKLGGKGNVVFYTIPGQPNLEDRLKGYKDILAGSPNIKIVDVVTTRGDSGNAFDLTDQYLGRTGAQKVDAIVCLESASGAAVAEVLKRRNITDRTVIAMDVEPETLAAVADGTIDSTISQKPYTMGYVGLKALDEAHHSHKGAYRTDYAVNSLSPFPAFVDTGTALVTKYNVSLFQHPTESANP